MASAVAVMARLRNTIPMLDLAMVRRFDPLDLWPVTDLFEREKLALFACCATPSTARNVWPGLARLWGDWECRPFRRVWALIGTGKVRDILEPLRLGAHIRPLRKLGSLPPTWSWHDLLPIIGNWQGRLVGLYGSPDAMVACLTRSVLRELRAVFPGECWLPKLIPEPGSVYERAECLFIELARRRGLKPWQLDRQIRRRCGMGLWAA